MRFVCPEVDGAVTTFDASMDVLQWVIKQRPDETATGFIDQSGSWEQVAGRQNNVKGYQQPFYALPNAVKLQNRISLTSNMMTIDELASALGVSIETSYTESSSFSWRVRGPYDLFRLPYWFTIYTETGIRFVKPAILSTSRNLGQITVDDIIDRSMFPKVPGYAGESGFDYTISADTSVVAPALITSSWKNAAINKHRAIRDVIIFHLGIDADPLDWVQGPDQGRYLIVSKKQDDENAGFVYWAVREYNEESSFTAGDETPVRFQLTDAGGSSIVDEYEHSGAAVNSYLISGLNLEEDFIYEWIVDFNAISGSVGWRVQFNDTTPSSVMTNYYRHFSILLNGAQTYGIASTDNRIFANDSGYPYGFRALVRQYKLSSGQFWIEFKWHDTRFRPAAYSVDRLNEGVLYYRVDGSTTVGKTNLTDLLLSAWTGSNTIQSGFRSLLLKHRV